MADWSKLSSRGRVDDRRSFGPVIGGGVGLTGIVLYLLFNLLSGGDITSSLPELNQILVQKNGAYNNEDFSGNDTYEVFASTVEGSNNDMWRDIFSQFGKNYTEPKLVLFRGQTSSACGSALSRLGPHYCELDQTIYLDETFFEEMKSRLGAQGGDVAEAYVIAHEIGHHAQYELGILQDVHTLMEENPDQENELSVKLELEADCFAGLWANSIDNLGVFEPGEIEEAIDAAKSVGDDRIQKLSTGRVNPEAWTHGSSAQRQEWFNRGYSSGNLAECNTFE